MTPQEHTHKQKARESILRGDCPLGGDPLHSLTLGPERRPAACAASLGVRGFISEVHGPHHEDRVHALKGALATLASQGIRRVHTIVTPGSSLESAALAVDFRPCPGETLFQRRISSPQFLGSNLHPSFTLRDGTLRDLLVISDDLTHIQELAFQGWEKLLIGQGLERRDRLFKVIEHAHTVVGIAIGGSHGERGTISHTWVAPEHRNHRLGQALSDCSLAALYQAGARVVHLMTTPANTGAERFWERQGFSREVSTYFLEKDL
ncbi:MAG: hypothetical protein RL518_996 [Pseudomonadota bacterium]|jgi:ribosomal protein S18 acetylase RimI-like enzyme